MIQILTEGVFFQGELIFLFIISINLHNLRIVSGYFLINNDDSFTEPQQRNNKTTDHLCLFVCA